MMAGTQSMALIIQASTAESSRPPQKEPKPLTSISLCSSFLTLPSLLSSVVVTCNLVLSLSLSLSLAQKTCSDLPLRFLLSASLSLSASQRH